MFLLFNISPSLTNFSLWKYLKIILNRRRKFTFLVNNNIFFLWLLNVCQNLFYYFFFLAVERPLVKCLFTRNKSTTKDSFHLLISTNSPFDSTVSLFSSFFPVSALKLLPRNNSLDSFIRIDAVKEIDGRRLLRYSVTKGTQSAVALTTCRCFSI